MRRVASRQRLFSWDQFDAAAADSSSSDGDNEDQKKNNNHNNTNNVNKVEEQNNNSNDYDYDSDYMSCLSQSRSNVGYSRSFSQLSLKNFSSAHADHVYFDFDGSDCDGDGQDNDQDYQRDSDTKDLCFSSSNLELDDANTNTNTNADANTNTNAASHAAVGNRTSYGTASSAKEQTRINVVSPPNSPRKPANTNNNIQTQYHAMMMMPHFPTLTLNPKKRSIDSIKKSVSFSTLLDAEINTNTNTNLNGNMNARNESLKQNFLNDMHQDVQIHCFQFLNLHDIKALSVTCGFFHNLLAYGTEIESDVDADADVDVRVKSQQQQVHHIMGIRNMLWWNIMQKQWPGLNLVTNADVETNANVNASLGALALLPERVHFINHSSTIMNYPALLSLCSTTPSTIAEKYFEVRPIRRFSLVGGGTSVGEDETRMKPIFRIFHMEDRDNTTADSDSDADAGADKEQQSNRKEVVQFMGVVGSGDQAITADCPFPRPIKIRCDGKRKNGVECTSIGNSNGKMSTSTTRGARDRRPMAMATAPMFRIQEVPIRRDSSSSTSTNDSYSKKSNFFDRLRGCKKYSNSVGAVILSSSSQARSRIVNGIGNVSNVNVNASEPQPFVSPYISSMTRQIEIDLTPRMIAYFEVSILPRDKLQEPRDAQGSLANISSNGQHRPGPTNPQFVRRHPRVDSACVAVGISVRGFQSSSRMPGWDSFSYGYHGDDGGIFHAQGDMIRVYGPTYNVGDTVGCGVNYHNGGIFYTLNGNFLGYAWVNEKIIKAAKSDLYPTVGVDSSDPIACNFGNERPFMFNFAGFVANNDNMPIPMNAH
jgi:hypothetical protein